MPVEPAPAVLRALNVLEYLRDRPHESYPLSDLARRLDMPRATCHSVLLALAVRGYVTRRTGTTMYGLGPACLGLGDAARTANPIMDTAQAQVRTLAEETGLSAAAGGLIDDQITVLLVEASAAPFGFSIRTGQSVPMQPPFGAVFVAWEPSPRFEHWLDKANPPLTATERKRYRAAAAALRARGFTINVHALAEPSVTFGVVETDPSHSDATVERRQQLINTIAHSEYLAADLEPDSAYRVALLSAPVFDHTRTVILELMLLGPPYDVPADHIHRLGTRLTESAQLVTDAVGGIAPLAPESA